LQWLAGEASGGLLLEQALTTCGVEDMVLTALLDSLPHNQTASAQVPCQVVSPRLVRRARDYIEQHIEAPMSVGDIAAFSGVSTRGLHLAFRK